MEIHMGGDHKLFSLFFFFFNSLHRYLAPRISIHTIHMAYARTIVQECTILESMRRIIGQRKTHRDIAIAPPDSMNWSAWQ